MKTVSPTANIKMTYVTSDWNKYVAEYHAEAHKWVLADVPRQVSVFEDKKLANARYKYAVHICKKKKKLICWRRSYYVTI